MPGSSSESSRNSRSSREVSASRRKTEKKDKKEKKEKRVHMSGSESGALPSGQFESLLAAINSSKKEVKAEVREVSGKITQVQTDLNNFKETTTNTLQDHSQQIKELQEKMGASGGGDVTDFEEKSKGKGKGDDPHWVPPAKRKCIFIGGFAQDSIKEEVEKEVTELTKEYEGINDIKGVGKLCSGCKVYFKDSKSMWSLLVSMKGKKFLSPNAKFDGKLSHAIDKTGPELYTSFRVSAAARELRACVVGKGLDQGVIDGDWNKGYLYLKNPNSRAIRLIDKPFGTDTWVVCEGAKDAVTDFDFEDLIQRMNSGERM